MSMMVRLATEDDAEELSILNQQFNGGDIIPMPDIKDSLARSNELIAVAVLNGRIVGFACAQSFASFCYRELQGEITELYVQEAARRMGIATSLITLLEKQLHARGVKSIKVLTGRKNDAALRTYELSRYRREGWIALHKQL